MSNLKDTDIDDLFRRASDKYPLRTDTADWDRMAAALDKEPPTPGDAVEEDDKRRRRRFFWLFLLLPLAGAGYYVMHHGGNSIKPVVAGGAMTQPAAAGNTARQPVNTSGTSGQPVRTSGTLGQPGTAGSTAMQQGGGAAAQTGAAGGNVPEQGGGSPMRPGVDIVTRRGTASGNGMRPAADATRAVTGNMAQDGRNFSGLRDEGRNVGIGGHWPGGQNAVEDRLFYDLQRAPISRDYRLAVNVTAPAPRKDTSVAKAKQHTKHFYAGLVGAPDLSTVKMQSVKGVGSTFGVLLGYSLSSHWSIETGVYVDRKKYYTDGEYFNTKEVNLPQNADLLYVNGVCYMWEIPLNVRYNFNPGAKTAWFATAGFSSYLMSHEKYAYDWKWYGGGTARDNTWNIHKSSQYPFSIINLSAGFEQRLGKVGSLRIEPYMRLPLGGLGTGKLPIMSAGVNIGITRQLW
ncbi:MAG TPA: outer membrane beta-barrel protein [Puia sp.]|nr:outer membrane beta-barrel protein [Puia sp.]